MHWVVSFYEFVDVHLGCLVRLLSTEESQPGPPNAKQAAFHGGRVVGQKMLIPTSPLHQASRWGLMPDA